MDNVSTTSDTTSLASAANFLLSLSGGQNSADAQLFAQFLAQNQDDVQNQSESSAQIAPEPAVQAQTQTQTQTQLQAPVVSSQIAVDTSTTNQPVTPTLKNLAAAWHTVLNKLQNLQKPKMVATTDTAPKTTAKTKNQTNDAVTSNGNNNASTTAATKNQPASMIAGSASSSSPTTSTTSNTAAATAATTTASAPSLIASTSVDASGSATAATDTTGAALNPKTIAELLAELQILAQMITKQLQATSGNSPGQASTAATSGTDSAASLSGASSSADATLPISGTSSATQGATSDAGLLAALNSFTASLQALTSGTGAASSMDTTDTTPVSTANSDAATGNTTSDTASTPTAQSLSNLLALAQLISKQLDATPTGTASATSAVSTTTSAATQTALPTLAATIAPVTSKLQSLIGALKPDITTQVQTKTVADDATNAASSTASGAANGGTSLASTGTTAPLAANVFKNSDVQQNGVLNSFSPTVPTNANTSPPAFIPVAAGLTDSGVNKDGAFDLSKESQNNNAFSSSAQNASNDATNLSSTLESGSSASSPYSFASQLAATKATGTGVAGLPPAVEQVMLQLNRSAKSGNDQMTLQLNPTDLGRVSIKLNIASDGKVQGTVVANNPATLDMLQKDSRSLERALQDAGLRADSGSLQFSLGGQPGNSSGQLAKGSTQSSGTNTTQNLATDSVAATTDPTETYYVTPGRVNLRV